MRARVRLRREEERKVSQGRLKGQPAGSASRFRSPGGQPSPLRASLLLAHRTFGNRWVQRHLVTSDRLILRDPKKPESDNPPTKAGTRQVNVSALKGIGP